MTLIAVLLGGLTMAFVSAVTDYYQYEAMVAEYNAWVIATNANAA